MKYEQLTPKERTNVKKYIKEELLINQKVKLPINPNEFDYSPNNGGVALVGRLKNMDDRQIKAKIIRFVKWGLKPN